MILDVHGQPLVRRVEAGALGDGPALERAVELEPEVIVQAAGVVALDVITEFAAWSGDFAARFRGLPEVAFFPVAIQSHGVQPAAARGARLLLPAAGLSWSDLRGAVLPAVRELLRV